LLWGAGAAEAAKDEPLGGLLDEADGGVGEGDDEEVRDPGVESDEVEALGPVMVVDELEEVEVQEVEGEGGFAEEDERPGGEDRGDGIGTGEAEEEQAEERKQESSVNDDVGDVRGAKVEEGEDHGQARGAKDEALTGGKADEGVELGQGEADEKGAEVGCGGVFEDAHPDGSVKRSAGAER